MQQSNFKWEDTLKSIFSLQFSKIVFLRSEVQDKGLFSGQSGRSVFDLTLSFPQLTFMSCAAAGSHQDVNQTLCQCVSALFLAICTTSFKIIYLCLYLKFACTGDKVSCANTKPFFCRHWPCSVNSAKLEWLKLNT